MFAKWAGFVSVADRIRLIQRKRHLDARGWLVKVIEGNEDHLPPRTGEVYLTLANPGESRGNHYHERASEWFTVVQGVARVALADVVTGERIELDPFPPTSDPVTLYVPPGIAHVFHNPREHAQSMILVAYADCPYDPTDTVVYPLL